jgi:hypothetical protein
MRLLLALLVACGSPQPAPTPKQPAPPAEPKRSAPGPAATSKNPSGCPAAEPNINALCTKPNLECTYGASRCPPVYVCTKARRFEAQFRGCPK